MAADVLGVLDALALERVHLVGHSMGKSSPTYSPPATPTASTTSSSRTSPHPHPAHRTTCRAHPGDLTFDWDLVPAIRGQIDTAGPHWWDLLDPITAPTLVIGGGPTSQVSQRYLLDVVRRLLDARMVTISAGHNVYEHEPAAFAAAVLEHLDQPPDPAVAPRPRRPMSTSGDVQQDAARE